MVARIWRAKLEASPKFVLKDSVILFSPGPKKQSPPALRVASASDNLGIKKFEKNNFCHIPESTTNLNERMYHVLDDD